jgi:hypothetical protein
MTPYSVSITTLGGPSDVAKEHSTDLAWEHALMLASIGNEDVGSDEFIEMFGILRQRYNLVGEHFGYLQHFSLRVLQELMQSGMAVVYPAKTNDQELEVRFHTLSSIILSAIAWTYASATEGWIPNSEWDEKSEGTRTISFDVLQAKQGEEPIDNDE